MTPSDLHSFFLLALVLYGSPGPATISLAASGAAVGARRALPYVAGMLAGFCVTVFLAAAGLGAIFALRPALFSVFRWLAFGFILYLAWKLARVDLSRAAARVERRIGFVDAFVLNVLNPKAYIAAMAVMTTFADPDAAPLASAARFLLYLLPLVAATNVVWCLAGSLIARRIERPDVAQWIMPALASLLAVSAAWALL